MKISTAVASVALAAACSLAAGAAAAFTNGGLWPDANGVHINAHGGGILKDGGRYWWYGEHKIAGGAGNRAHVGVHVYSSVDLLDWRDEGIALAVSESPDSDIAKGCILERPKVLKCPSTGRYVMYFHLERANRGYNDARVGIAVADRPQGPFTFVRSERPNRGTAPQGETLTAERIAASRAAAARVKSNGPSDEGRAACLWPAHSVEGQHCRDMTLFQDDDGTAYHIFSSEHNSTLHIAELTADYLGYTGRWWRLAEKDWTEAPAVIKHGGWYYLLGSGCTGWRPNAARYYRARAVTGPWERMGNPCTGVNPANGKGPELTWGGQSTFILPPDAATGGRALALFDIWKPDNAIDGRYVWLPVTFGDGTIEIAWADTWRPAATGWPAVTKEMKPWAYNWWMGSAVDAAGLQKQIDEMEKVGMGGFHVIPIYSVKDNPADKPLLSPAWMTAFGDAVRRANEKGMGVDLTTGSGWCFGGPQLKPEEGSWMLELNTKRPEKSTVLWRGTDADGKAVVLSARPTGQKVKRSGPGAHGPMMNPLSAGAMASFLKPFTAAYDAPGAPKPEHMYHDSYEYFSAGWSWELPAAFKARRGYDLADHYAELAGVGDPETVARVKADYRETLSEMMIEDVFAQWQDWCAARGIATRNEAHGAPANWLDFYALADIPETEMFSCDKARARTPAVEAGFMNSGDRDIVISKFASSAAHVKHAGASVDPLVSAESCTWVCEHFCETLGAVKTFVDRLFLSGVNHMFYHGMCYSPADAKWPGWTFYATCEMNRFNPIWRDADILNAYITRVQSVAQTTAIDNDVLVYWPLHDFWHDAAGFEKQMTVHARDWFGGQPIGRVARTLYDEGYSFDFISERQLGTLGAPAATRYTTIVVPGAVHMKVATLRRLFALAEAGYRVLFVDGFPTTVPGLKDVAAGERELAALVAAPPANVAAGPLGQLIHAAPARREPFNKAAGLAYTRHRKDGTTYYFIANPYRNAGVTGAFKPSAACVRARLMDPMTGTIEPVAVTDGAVALDLPIGHSVILAVTGDAAGAETVARRDAPARRIALDGDWTRTAVAGGPELPEAKTGPLPLAWGREETFPESAFAGTMRYVTKVTLAEGGGGRAVLDLGRVRESAKVYVNGVFAGGVILAPWTVAFDAALLKPGANEIAVEVTSTGANRLKWLDTAKPYEWKIFTDINMVDINYQKFDASGWPQHEAGLYGPVSLRLDAPGGEVR